jgi:hypothetical protein
VASVVEPFVSIGVTTTGEDVVKSKTLLVSR